MANGWTDKILSGSYISIFTAIMQVHTFLFRLWN